MQAGGRQQKGWKEATSLLEKFPQGDNTVGGLTQMNGHTQALTPYGVNACLYPYYWKNYSKSISYQGQVIDKPESVFYKPTPVMRGHSAGMM